MKTYTTIDKREWGEGPWQTEPDKAHWVDEKTGLDCLIVRNHMGALCGYVGVPPRHPDFGKSYDDMDVRVYGGLTFAAPCRDEADEAHGICHVGEEVWWFGFDCAHAMDLVPGHNALMDKVMPGRLKRDYEVYRDFGFVQEEVELLAGQLQARRGSRG